MKYTRINGLYDKPMYDRFFFYNLVLNLFLFKLYPDAFLKFNDLE